MCWWVTNSTVSVVQDHRHSQVVLSRWSSEWIKCAACACLSSQYTGGEVREYSTSLGYRVRPCINKVKWSRLGIKNLSILSWPLWRLDLVLTGKVQRYISRCICGVFPETMELFKMCTVVGWKWTWNGRSTLVHVDSSPAGVVKLLPSCPCTRSHILQSLREDCHQQLSRELSGLHPRLGLQPWPPLF